MLFENYQGQRRKTGVFSGPLPNNPTTTTTTTITTTITTTNLPAVSFKKDTLFRGDQVSSVKNPSKTRSVELCWSKCEENDDCNFISWFKKTRKCILFETYNGQRRKAGVYSGPVPGKTTNREG